MYEHKHKYINVCIGIYYFIYSFHLEISNPLNHPKLLLNLVDKMLSNKIPIKRQKKKLKRDVQVI